MEAILSVTSIILFLSTVIITVDWSIHVGTRKESLPYGWAGYRKFKEEFNKGQWEYDKDFKGALFEKDNRYGWDGTRDEIFVGKIVFNGKGMVIHNPISYALCMLYVRKYIRNSGMLPKKDSSQGKVKKWY